MDDQPVALSRPVDQMPKRSGFEAGPRYSQQMFGASEIDPVGFTDSQGVSVVRFVIWVGQCHRDVEVAV
jgi:hypothetical protein